MYSKINNNSNRCTNKQINAMNYRNVWGLDRVSVVYDTLISSGWPENDRCIKHPKLLEICRVLNGKITV